MNCTWIDTKSKYKVFICEYPSPGPNEFSVFFHGNGTQKQVASCARWSEDSEEYVCFYNEPGIICKDDFSNYNCTSPKIWVTDKMGNDKYGMFRCQSLLLDPASARTCEWPLKDVKTSGNITNWHRGKGTISTDTDGTLGVGPICGISVAVLIVIAIVAGLVIGYKKKWKTSAKTDENGNVSVEKDKDCEAGKHVDFSKDLLEREETWDGGFSSPIQSPHVKLREKICYMPVPVAQSVDDEFSPVAHPVDDEFSPVAHPVEDEFSPVAHPVDDVPSSVAHPMDDEDSYDHRVNELG